MPTNDRIVPPVLKRTVCFGILYCFLFCLAAFGAGGVSRTYNYRGFDTNGNLLVAGAITLLVDESVQVKGDWKLQVLNRHRLKELGPQDGSGKIIGQFKGDGFFLNLNPDIHENNIYLDGKITGADIFKINGKWGYYGFEGKLFEGTFEMVRKENPPKGNHPADSSKKSSANVLDNARPDGSGAAPDRPVK
jgi:hypothetical protein